MAAADRQPAPITIASIQAALPRGAALVEFVRYHRVDPKLPARPQVEHYLAYVLPSQGSPSFVPLGEAAPIDQEIGTLFVAMHTSLKPTDGDPGGVDPMMKSFIQAMRKRHLKRLDDLLLAPVRAHLRNVTHLILSPDSALHAVPFEALVDGEGHYEIERRLVSYVTSGRDLLRFHDPRPPRSPATIIAVPDYGVPGATVSPARSSFRRLEGALSEVTTLTAHFASVRTITGKDATKAALADLPPPCASDPFPPRHDRTAKTPSRALAAAPVSARDEPPSGSAAPLNSAVLSGEPPRRRVGNPALRVMRVVPRARGWDRKGIDGIIGEPGGMASSRVVDPRGAALATPGTRAAISTLRQPARAKRSEATRRAARPGSSPNGGR